MKTACKTCAIYSMCTRCAPALEFSCWQNTDGLHKRKVIQKKIVELRERALILDKENRWEEATHLKVEALAYEDAIRHYERHDNQMSTFEFPNYGEFSITYQNAIDNFCQTYLGLSYKEIMYVQK